MSDLETLRPEVREAVDAFDIGARIGMTFGNKGWNIIRAELLRLARYNDALRSKCNVIMSGSTQHLGRAERAEAELAALKERMKPCAQVIGGEVRALMDQDDEGKYVAVLVVEE